MLAFEEQPTGFSLKNALLFAEASRLAYKEQSEVQTTVKGWGLDGGFAFFDRNDTQGFLATDDQKAVLAFRGTEVARPRDVLADVLFRKRPDAFGHRVHRGFKAALDQVWEPDIVPALGDLAAGKRLWITGHSLGAALAVLAAARQLEAGGSVAGLYPLGQPRVGNGPFVRELNSRMENGVFRIVNYIDIVPRVPPLSFGFRHLKDRVYIGRAGAVGVGASVWKVISEGVGARLRHPLTQVLGIDEHNTGRYIAGLKAALE